MVGGALLKNRKEKLTKRLPFTVPSIVRLSLLIKQENEGMLSSDFMTYEEIENKSIFSGKNFISTYLHERESAKMS